MYRKVTDDVGHTHVKHLLIITLMLYGDITNHEQEYLFVKKNQLVAGLGPRSQARDKCWTVPVLVN